MTTRSLFSLVLISALCAFTASATAEPYWITYEGNDLPENEGWTRYWGNADGEYQGDGAIRTVEDGILTMDTLHDPWIYDYAQLFLPGQIDPEPGELFVMEWRLKIDQVDGSIDPSIGVCSDTAMSVWFVFDEDSFYSHHEGSDEIPIVPGVFHEYRMISPDMEVYELYVDGDLALAGTFWQGVGFSEIGWGASGQPLASRSHWDYARFGVIPEPSSMLLILATLGVTRASSARAHYNRSTHHSKEC